jgi:hypothetical protein
MDKYKIRQVVLLPNKILKNWVSEMKRNFSKLSLHKNINNYSYKMFLHFAKKTICFYALLFGVGDIICKFYSCPTPPHIPHLVSS